ncbi:hypothetical protein GGI21_000655 [Coemansia aciculifera]|uniref:Uncharacterized protein n=1 Tax=Coemansia aciculifera TaxID=417176 RepID=A0ACC1M6L3_9FUNG|nr:hypothetical protein IWW38_001606 [Coemansia aciculifera]KAJ2910655.1 hypothetical protein GGI21_000655 [Coemansia aciculifera]
MSNRSNTADSKEQYSSDPFLFGPRLFHDLWLDVHNLLDLPPLQQLAFHPDRDMRSFRSTIVTPPYARVLGGLGLFDPISEPPKQIERGPNKSAFPVVSYSARGSTPPRASIDRSDREPSLADVMARDGSRIIGSVGEAFGETTRWAVGNLFGQVREAMDIIESKVHQDAQSIREQQHNGPDFSAAPATLYKALKSDLLSGLDSMFPEPGDEDRTSYSSYQITMRTLPDGSVETRKTVHKNDGSKSTTVTLHHSDPNKEDIVTTC